MVSASFLSAMVATALAGLATALPQTATASSAPAAETTPSVAELEAIPMEFPPLDPKAEPVEGKSNETLLVAAPYLEEIVESAPDLNTTLTKRSLNLLEKREQCDGEFNPSAQWYIWSFYANSFCNRYFPTDNAYYIVEGYCFEGRVPRSGTTIPANLNYKYCTKACGAHTNFVAITNTVCKAQFTKIIHHAISEWYCPGYLQGAYPGWISGGNNFDQTADPADWSIKATW